ncbi:MAG: secretin N-terminal domain-containing protein [Verrucomicrobiota bacterium]
MNSVTTPIPAQNSDSVPMTIIGMPVEGVIQIYRRLTGFQVIEGQNLQGPTITIKTDGTVPKEEAIRLIEAALLLHGYVIVPSGPNTVKILNSQAQNPRSEGLPIYTDLNDLPVGDKVVSFFTNLEHITATEAASALQAASVPSAYTVILPVESNQSIVVTEKTSVIRQLMQLKTLIDTPQASLKREFIQLTRADAERVAEQLQNLIQSSSSNARTNNRAANNANNNNANNATANANAGNNADAIGSLNAETVKIVPDTRTNRILVVAPKSSFEYLKQLVLDFDSAVDFSQPLTRPLRYVKAGEILPVLGEFLAEGEEEVEITDAESESSTNNTGGGGGNTLSRPDQLSDSGLESAPQSLTVGKTRIIADRRNNSILIMGPTENINRAAVILDSLDIPAQQVYLSAVIGQITLDDTTEFGVDILRQFNSTGDFGTATQSVTQPVAGGSLIDPRTLVTTGAFPAGTAGAVVYGTFMDSVDVFVRALKTTNNFKILARPTVFTTNNKKAVLLSGRREPIPTQSLSSLNNDTNINSSVTTNVDFEDVVLKLEVIPLINSDNQVTLTIAQQNDSLSGTRDIGGNSVPIINTQELLTEVTVNNGNTVILGGLIEDSAQDETTGVPLLSDIPLIGNLFKTTTRNRPRRELIIMLQPEIVRTIDDVAVASQRRETESFIGPDAVEFSETGGSQRTELDSMWKLKQDSPGPVPPRAEIVTPVTPVEPTTIQFIPAEPEPAPVEVEAPESDNIETTNGPSTDEDSSPLVQPSGIERPQAPQ